MHVFLTGEKGIGKSRTAAAAAALLGLPCVGFRTAFQTEDRHASSLYLLPAGEQDQRTEAHVAAVWRDGKLTEADGAFDTWGAELLREARQHPKALILMDECGHAERNALTFQNEIKACLDGTIPVLGVLRKGQAWHEMIKRHPKVQVLEVTLENRERLPREIAALLRRKEL